MTWHQTAAPPSAPWARRLARYASRVRAARRRRCRLGACVASAAAARRSRRRRRGAASPHCASRAMRGLRDRGLRRGRGIRRAVRLVFGVCTPRCGSGAASSWLTCFAAPRMFIRTGSGVSSPRADTTRLRRRTGRPPKCHATMPPQPPPPAAPTRPRPATAPLTLPTRTTRDASSPTARAAMRLVWAPAAAATMTTRLTCAPPPLTWARTATRGGPTPPCTRRRKLNGLRDTPR